MTTTLTKARTAVGMTVRRVGSERGDVPGWVLITLMTAALVVGLWAIAGEQLQGIFQDALDGVTGPDDPR